MDYDYCGMLPPEPSEEVLTEEEKQKRKEQLVSVLSSAAAYIDSAMYQLDGAEPFDGIDLSEITDSLFDVRESIDEIRDMLTL